MNLFFIITFVRSDGYSWYWSKLVRAPWSSSDDLKSVGYKFVSTAKLEWDDICRYLCRYLLQIL